MKPNWPAFAVVSPNRHYYDETRVLAGKNSKINPFVVKSVFEPKMQTFQWKWKTQYYQPKHNPEMKIFIHVNRLTFLTKTMKKIEVYLFSFSFVQTTIKHKVKDLQTSPKFQAFSILWRPETNCRQKEGSPTNKWINMVHYYHSETNYCVNGVEHEKTVTSRKNLRRNKWFWELFKKDFVTTCGKKARQEAKTWEVKLDCVAKAQQLRR